MAEKLAPPTFLPITRFKDVRDWQDLISYPPVTEQSRELHTLASQIIGSQGRLNHQKNSLVATFTAEVSPVYLLSDARNSGRRTVILEQHFNQERDFPIILEIYEEPIKGNLQPTDVRKMVYAHIDSEHRGGEWKRLSLRTADTERKGESGPLTIKIGWDPYESPALKEALRRQQFASVDAFEHIPKVWSGHVLDPFMADKYQSYPTNTCEAELQNVKNALLNDMRKSKFKKV